MKRPRNLGLVWLALVSFATLGGARAGAEKDAPETVDARHPGLSSGALTFAQLAELPKGVLVRCGAVTIAATELQGILANALEPSSEELSKSAFFLLEREVTPRLLLLLARKAPGANGQKSERQLIDDYLDGVTAQVKVADEEVARFYEENRQLFEATLEAVKGPIRLHLLEGKKEEAVDEHLRTLGQRLKIEVSATWADEQAPLAMDNPADKARRSGKPALVVFGGPCG